MFNFRKRQHLERAAADFQPDAILLESAGPGIPCHLVWAVILLLLVAGIVWASVSKIDKIVVADGRLVTTRQNITMKPLERSVIKTVHVLPGQRVSPGQLLFTFDVTGNRADLQRLIEQRVSLLAQQERLNAELNRVPFTPAESSGNDYRLQSKIFESRNLYFQEKNNTYDENIRRLEVTIEALEQSLVKYKERQEALKKIEDIFVTLHEKNATSTKELLQTQIEVIGMDIQVDQQTAQLLEYRHQLQALKAEKNSFLTDWRRQIIEELVEVDRNLISVDKQIPRAEMLVENAELRAPCAAVVHEIAPFQEGSAVREAESLITLVPLTEKMEAEVDIPAKDIGHVKLDDSARLKFDAYPFQQYGTLDGKLRYISQDAFTRAPAESMQSTDGQPSYYQGRMVISGRFNGRNEHLPLIPGMRLRAEIKVGERTVISYLFYPFIKAMDESLREP